MRNFVLGSAAVIVLVALAFLVYSFSINKPNDQPVPKPLVPADETSIPAEETPTDEPGQTNQDADLIRQALFTKNKWPEDDKITVDVSTNDGKYASGTVNSTEGGGGYFYAAKVDNIWKIVADGNGVIACSSLVPYPDYPVSLIPACYDDKTSELKKR